MLLVNNMYLNKALATILLIYSIPSMAMLEGELVRFAASQPYGGAPYSKDVVEQAKIDIKKNLVESGENKYVLRFTINEKHQECDLNDVDRPFFAIFYVGAELKQVRPTKTVISELEFEVTGSSLHVGRKNCNGLDAKNQALMNAAQLWNLQMRKLYGQDVQDEIESLALNMQKGPSHSVGSLMFKGLFHSANGAEVVLEGMLEGGKAVIDVAGEIGGAIVDNSGAILTATQAYNATYSGNTNSDPAMEILNQSQRDLAANANQAIAEGNKEHQATIANSNRYASSNASLASKSTGGSYAPNGENNSNQRSSFNSSQKGNTNLQLQGASSQSNYSPAAKENLSAYPVESHKNISDCIEYKGTWVKNLNACFSRDSLMRESCKAVINKGNGSNTGLGHTKPGSCSVYLGTSDEGVNSSPTYDKYEARDLYSGRALNSLRDVTWEKIMRKKSHSSTNGSASR